MQISVGQAFSLSAFHHRLIGREATLPLSKLPPVLASFIDNHDDSDLLVRLRNRDPEAVGLLFDRYGNAAYALALRIVREPSLAEDVVAEAVLKMWNRVASFRETRSSALGVWFLAITFVQARESVQQRTGTTSGKPSRECVMEKPAVFQDWPRSLNPDRLDEIYLSLFLLSEHERQALNVSFFQGISSARLAEYVETSTEDGEKLIKSALSKLSVASDSPS